VRIQGGDGVVSLGGGRRGSDGGVGLCCCQQTRERPRDGEGENRESEIRARWGLAIGVCSAGGSEQTT
jgi:hypothetical protein